MRAQLFSSTAISAGPLPAWDGCALTPPSGKRLGLLKRFFYLAAAFILAHSILCLGVYSRQLIELV
jgi:hypothetical protein